MAVNLLNRILDYDHARKGGKEITSADGLVEFRFYGVLLTEDAVISQINLFAEWEGSFTGSAWAGFYLPVQGTAIQLSAGTAILFRQPQS